MPLEIKTIALGSFQANCYILKSGGECVVIDPGDEDKSLIELIDNCHVKYILNTHCHPDHIGGDGFIKKAFNAPLLFHRADQALFQFFYGASLKADGFLAEGDLIKFGDAVLSVWHTPGHSPGSITLIHDRSLFTGDLLFAGSIGRTDLPGGSDEEMAKSLRRLQAFEGDYRIYPGHGPATTLEAERRYNPFLINLAGTGVK